MATKEMTIKLMIDPESDRLIFAEASNDFVDFLIYLLSLPIGTATKLLTSESMVGSIGNIYTSVANLDVTYLRPDVNRNVFLDPMVFSSAINTPLPAATSSSRKFYTCGNPECKRRGISDVRDEVRCPECHGYIYLEVQFIDKDSEGYVHDVASYMISDDLSITSISTMSIMSMMNKFNVTKPEERVVKIGTEEALELLKASLQSTTVLTDVFLKRNKRKQPADEEAEAEAEAAGLYRVVKSSIDNGMKEIRAVLDLQHAEIRRVLAEPGAENRRVLAEHGAILDELIEKMRLLV